LALTSLAVTRFAVMRWAVIRFAETILPLATGLPVVEDFLLVDFGAGLLLIRDFFAMAMSDSPGFEIEISLPRTALMHLACQTSIGPFGVRNSLNSDKGRTAPGLRS
jgi:hypothetical protein